MTFDNLLLLAQANAEGEGVGFGDSLFWIVLFGVAAIFGLFLLIGAIAFAAYGKTWFQAYMSSADVSMPALIGMGFRQVNSRLIVQAKIMAAQAGLDTNRKTGISTQRLEAHYLAGGNVTNVILAIIAAQRAMIPLDFDRAAAIDLAGRDVLDAVRTSVSPKIIDCPDPRSGKGMLSAVAKNGIEMLIKARVTVRTNLTQLIGGATEETIVARVGQGIVTSIGSAESHKDVLENPNKISRNLLDRGLDSQTAFEIVSIDIAQVQVGQNIGARLQADAAEADTRVARAQAERKRSEAIAMEQEMKAKVAENRARLVEAEAQVPLAMADAFRKGNLTSNNAKPL
ncbi:MAG: flotillin-like protein FloA [Pirellulaceae bacterium]